MDHFTFEHLDNKPSPTPLPKPSPKSEPGFVIARVEVLMSSYRMADYHNPKGFVATMVSILEEYPPEIVEYVTDPKTGIQRRSKWPPTPSEVVEACAAEIGWRTKVRQNSSLSPVPRLPSPKGSSITGDGGPGTVYDAKAFEEAVKRHGRPTGPFERFGDDWNRQYGSQKKDQPTSDSSN